MSIERLQPVNVYNFGHSQFLEARIGGYRCFLANVSDLRKAKKAFRSTHPWIGMELLHMYRQWQRWRKSDNP